MGDAAGAVDGHDAYTLTDAEDLILLHGLYVGAHAAVVFAYGDFHTLGTRDAFLGCRAQQATGYRTDHRRHGRATATADAATGYTCLLYTSPSPRD